MAINTFGDISPRTAAYAAKELLKRATPYLVYEKFGQAKQLPGNSSKVEKFRRYKSLSTTPTALTEGVTPTSQTLTFDDVTATLAQYGGVVTITDVVQDTHEDNVLTETVGLLGEQAAQQIENMRFGVLKACTTIEYSGSAALTTDVIEPITTEFQRRAVRTLKRQNARPITSIVRSTPSFGTENVAPGFVAIVHPDVEGDVRKMTGFTPAEKYGSITPWENEIGKVDDVRYVSTTINAAWPDAGANKGAMWSTTGVKADVYPVIFLGRDAYGIVALKGAFAVTPMVSNAKPGDSDPLAQRTHVGWKTMQTCVILNDKFMVVGKVAATA